MEKFVSAEKQKESLSLTEIEFQLEDMRSTLKKNMADLSDINTEKERAIRLMEETLQIIPGIKRLKILHRLETAINKYRKPMRKVGIPDAVVDFVIFKKKQEIKESDFRIPVQDIYEVEKKLGIIQWSSAEKDSVYSSFRGFLTEERNLVEIEAILRKVRLRIDEPSEMKAELLKEEVSRYFAIEAGFEECSAVVQLLMNKDLANAMKNEIVTQKDLLKELNRLKGDMTGLSETFTKKLNMSFARLNGMMPGEMPFWLRFFSYYIVTPFSGTLGGAGFAVLLIYSFVEYLYKPIKSFLPAVTDLFDALNITILCNTLKPQTVFLTGFIFIFIAGLIKLTEEKLKQKYSNKKSAG